MHLIYTVKLPVHSFGADVDARGGLDFCSYWVNGVSTTFMQ